jgi:hypothetical protein
MLAMTADSGAVSDVRLQAYFFLMGICPPMLNNHVLACVVARLRMESLYQPTLWQQQPTPL